ncbi:MAG: HAMP domain-containing protein, partial [Deltaproteobacteria bacterium]
MAKKLKISLKYKFLLVLLSTLALGFSTFFALAYRTFSEDKKLFVMELNLSILKTAISDTRADLKSRVDELQTFLPKIYEISTPISNVIFRELSLQHLPNELLGVRFYRKNLTDASFTLIKDFKNTDLFQNRSLADSVLEQIDRTVPPQLETFSFAEETKILNRSIKTSGFSGVVELPVITFLVSGSFVNDSSKSVVIVVDLVQDFLRKKLSQSELAEVFLISKNGMLISHSSTSKLLQNSQKTYSHPIVEKLKTRQLPRESLELKIGSENYLCNLSETGFADVYAISQIKESEAFQALKTLMKETLLTGIFVFSIALIISIIFSNKLTANIKKLKMGAQSIGRGDFEVKLNIKSNDEIQNVADSFNWMASRIKQLITETVTKE